MKHVLAKIDYKAESYSLHYLHTKERQEVDFALVNENKVERIIEAKYSDSALHSPLRYFAEKYHFPATQVVKELKRERMESDIAIVKAENFLPSLDL